MTNKCYSIDLYKFILSLAVLTLHYNWQFIPLGYLAVESFFLITGFYLCVTRDKMEEKSFANLLICRIGKIYPSYALVLVVWAIVLLCVYDTADLLKTLPVYLSFLHVFTTKGIGFGYIGYLGYLWFVPVYILCMAIFLFVSKYLDKQKSIFFCIIIAVTSISLLQYFSPSGSINYSIEDMSPIHIGVLRGIEGMAIGYLSAYIYIRFCPKQKEKHSLGVIMCTLAELVSLLYIAYIFTTDFTISFDYTYIVVSAMFIVLLNLNRGVFSRIIEKIAEIKAVRYISSISMQLYFVHYLIINEYKRLFEQDTSELGLLICVFVSIAFSLVLKWFNKFINQLFKRKKEHINA